MIWNQTKIMINWWFNLKVGHGNLALTFGKIWTMCLCLVPCPSLLPSTREWIGHSWALLAKISITMHQREIQEKYEMIGLEWILNLPYIWWNHHQPSISNLHQEPRLRFWGMNPRNAREFLELTMDWNGGDQIALEMLLMLPFLFLFFFFLPCSISSSL